MLFSSNIFLFLFLPATLLGYYLLRPSVQLKNYFLLMMSLGFYAWGEPVYVFLTTLMAESEEELKSLLMKVKEESEKLA